ncbi:MAG: hypothetical protein Rhob2KO_39500 [Rhodopirellula baltica]
MSGDAIPAIATRAANANVATRETPGRAGWIRAYDNLTGASFVGSNWKLKGKSFNCKAVSSQEQGAYEERYPGGFAEVSAMLAI